MEHVHVTEHGAQQFINTIRVPPASPRKNSTRQYLMYCRNWLQPVASNFLRYSASWGSSYTPIEFEPMCFLKHSETLA